MQPSPIWVDMTRCLGQAVRIAKQDRVGRRRQIGACPGVSRGRIALQGKAFVRPAQESLGLARALRLQRLSMTSPQLKLVVRPGYRQSFHRPDH